MCLCQYLIIFLLGLSSILADSSIPRTIQYQGRFLDAATNLPVQGTISRQLTINVRRVDSSGTAGAVLFSHTANSVTIRDGVFNIEIPVPANILFDEPYGIEVVVQGSGGGNIGLQKLRSVPYAFTAHNALQFGGRDATDFAAKEHTHDKLNQKSFTIDGSGSLLLPTDPQFTIINGDASVVFEVDASGNIRRVNEIRASGNIETSGKLIVRDSADEIVFEAGSDGTVYMAGDLFVSGTSKLGSLVVTGIAKMEDVRIDGRLTFGEFAEIKAPDTGDNPIGKSHVLEDHADSDMMTKLRQLTSGGNADELHTHSLAVASITSEAIADNSIGGVHIKDGAITNAEIAANAAIEDTKLRSITRQIITSQALPSEVVLRNKSNVFGAGFATLNQKGRIDTTNYFDDLRAKSFSVISTNTNEGMNFFELSNQSGAFKWQVDGSGMLSFSRLSGSVYLPVIEIKNEGGETKVKLSNVTIEGESLITGREIKDGSIEARDIATGTISSDKIVDGAVTSDKIRDASITSNKIADGAVTAEKILNNSVESVHIAAGAVISSKIPDGSITSSKIQDNSISGTKIQDNSISGTKIASNAITRAHIQAGTIEADHLAANSISTGKIKAGAIGNTHLDPGVLVDRRTPMSINLTSGTTPHITLKSEALNNMAPMLTLKYDKNVVSTAPDPALLFRNISSDTSQNLVSLNYDGSISLRSSNFSQVVTIDPKIIATMQGVSVIDQNKHVCPMNTTYNHIFSSVDGDGFCIKVITNVGAEKQYKDAMVNCHSTHHGRLCRASELYRSCQAGFLNEKHPMMSADFGYTGGADSYVTFKANVNECENDDFTIGAKGLGDASFYACCINP